MKKYIMLILIILGSLFTSAIAVMQFIQAEVDKKKSNTKETQLNNKIDNLLANNVDQSGQIASLALANSELSKQLVATSTELRSNIIGGSKIKPNGYLIDPSHFRIQIKNVDEKTIFNAIISVIDLDKINQSAIVGQDDNNIRFSSKNMYEWFESGNSDINVGGSLTLAKTYDISDTRHFYVEITTRKDFQIMHMIVYKVGESIKEIHRIYNVEHDVWNLIEQDGSANEQYWKEKFYDKKRLGYDSSK